MKRSKKIILPTIAIAILAAGTIFTGFTTDEGMFPLSYLNEKQLRKSGLKLKVKDIYNPGGIALTNALVKVGGCTGSFISSEGLIITNHHCVYGGVADASNSEHNYLENGFTAFTRDQEIPIDMPVRITQSYDDVSISVLEGTSADMNPESRSKKIAENIKNVLAKEKAKYPDLSCEVSEMFVGKSYTLFRYILLKDVRLVFAPPVTIGQFGGDKDNWEWPRHNGDFSLVRVYTGPDGKPAAYSKNNVPYKPVKHLKINASGTKENDFVFIMGYPGRTFRNESAGYMKFQQEFQLPETQKFYAWMIKKMYEVSEGDENKYLSFAGDIQSLSNVEKNYRGKIQGLTRTDLVKQKQEEEMLMQNTLGSLPGNQTVIPEINKIWNDRLENAPLRYNYLWMLNNSNTVYAAYQIADARIEIQQMKDEKEKAEKLKTLKNNLLRNYTVQDWNLEKMLLSECMKRIGKLNPKLKEYDNPQCIETVYDDKLFSDTSVLYNTARENPQDLLTSNNKIIEFCIKARTQMRSLDSMWQAQDLQLKSLMPLYLNMREKYKKSLFLPDANSTLRLTYGYIRRYMPNDAEIHLPYTTLNGVFEKANTHDEYRLPKAVADNLRINNIPKILKDPKTGNVIVGFLYNLDTTGGNSGSPVLDKNGNLIGINFDRAFTATINDYAWNEKYSRSIGVDIRYVLYVMKYVGKADHLLKEIGVEIK